MHLPFLLEMAIGLLAFYFGETVLKPRSLEHFKNRCQISYNIPPPLPRVSFPNSADHAEDYHFRHLSEITVTGPSSIFLNETESTDNPVNPVNPVGSFFWIPFLPPLFDNMHHVLVQIASWIASAALENIRTALQILAAIGPPATAVYVLREQRTRDRRNLEIRSASFLEPFQRFIAILKSRNQELKEDLASHKEWLAWLDTHKRTLQAKIELQQKTLLTQQDTSNRRMEKMTEERNDLAQILQDLRAQQKESEDTIRELKVTLGNKDHKIRQCESELRAQQEDSLAKSTSYEAQIAGCKEASQVKMAEADQRFHKAQQTVKERIRELEEALHERQRAEAQTQARPSGSPHHPVPAPLPTAPMHFPPAPMGMQTPPPQSGIRFSPGQSQFIPRSTQIPGFPPKRTSGFMGNTPPPG